MDRTALLALVLALGCAPPPPLAGPVPALPSTDEFAFALLDRLGTPSVSGRPYVRVMVGHRDDALSAPGVIGEGFLLDEVPGPAITDTVTVTPFELSSGDPEVWLEPVDLVTRARATIAAGPAPAYSRRGLASPRLQQVALARAACQRNLPAECATLMRIAREGAVPDFISALRVDIAEVLKERAVEAVEDPAVSRPALRRRLQEVVAVASGSEAAGEASEMVAVLDRMIAEDRAHAPGSPESVPGWIHALREQQSFYPRIDVPCAPARAGGEEDSPALRLCLAGREAVPALLAIVDDGRLVRMHRTTLHSGCCPKYVVRYGTVALQILSRIAGRALGSRADAQAWWQDVQARGELALHAEKMAHSGGRAAAQAAARMLAADRPRALPEIIARARKGEPWMAPALLRALGHDPGEEQVPFLLEQAGTAELAARLAAADGLRRHGNAAWTALLLAEVERLVSAGLSAPLDGERTDQSSRATFALVVSRIFDEPEYSDVRFVTEAAGTLAAHGDAAAVEALGRIYPKLPLGARTEIVARLGERLMSAPKDMAVRAEDVLAQALDEQEAIAHFVMIRPPSERRVCEAMDLADLAAHFLGPRLGAPFRCDAAPGQRARERAGLAERWRLDRGRAPRRIRIADAAAPLPALAQLDAWRGRRIVPEDVGAFLADLVKAPRGTVELRIHREAGSDRSTVEVRSTPQHARRSGQRSSWTLRSGASVLHRPFSEPDPTVEQLYAGWRTVLDKVLQVGPTDGEVRLRVEWVR